MNHDGKTNVLTAPNGPSQEAVIREAWRSAGKEGMEYVYAECHGTGTPLGDPIEINALSRVMEGVGKRGLVVGSAKANFGHCESAAGIVGLMKVALSIWHRSISPHVLVGEVNPLIEFGSNGLELL